jgi:hypothetical protein
MAYRPFRIQGVPYDLSHLNPFLMQVTPTAEGAPTYSVHVSFGSHTFSKEWDAATHTPDYRVVYDERDPRCFCPVRHGHSLELPDMIRGAVTGKAYFSLQTNYLVFKPNGDGNPYVAFFSVKPANNPRYDAVMFVQSAYAKPALKTASLQGISFATLVSKTVRGEPVSRPKRK